MFNSIYLSCSHFGNKSVLSAYKSYTRHVTCNTTLVLFYRQFCNVQGLAHLPKSSGSFVPLYRFVQITFFIFLLFYLKLLFIYFKVMCKLSRLLNIVLCLIQSFYNHSDFVIVLSIQSSYHLPV